MNRSLVVAVVVLAGCNGSPIAQTYDNARAAGAELCECFMQAGFESREACLDAVLNVTDAQLDCLEREYAENAAAAEPTVTCQNDAFAALAACLGAVDGCDAAMLSACTRELGEATSACPPLPESVALRFAMCSELADRDGDGIADGVDECPSLAEDLDGVEDADGCPDGGAPAGNTYSACVETADCTDLDDQCVMLTVPAAGTSGTFCTHACSSDLDCESSFGFAGACYDVEAAGFLCYQACELDSDCSESNVCVQIDLGGGTIDFICLPDN